jgi:hypothetical protein
MNAELMKQIAALHEGLTELKISDAKKTVILDRVEKNLTEHMRRTDLLEKFTAKWAGVWTGLAVLASLAAIGKFILELWR